MQKPMGVKGLIKLNVWFQYASGVMQSLILSQGALIDEGEERKEHFVYYQLSHGGFLAV